MKSDSYLVNTRMRIKRDIGKGQLCSRGGGGVLLRILGVCAPSVSLNPNPISDQNMPFSVRYYALVVPLKIRFQTIMVNIYICFQTKTAQKAYSSMRHIPI